jgi:hypothetical protein
MQNEKELLLKRLGLFEQTIRENWEGYAVYTVLKFESTDDFNAAYVFFKKNFDPRCFNTGMASYQKLFLIVVV